MKRTSLLTGSTLLALTLGASSSVAAADTALTPADVIYHNACGASGVVGEAQLTNWNFAFDIAQGGEGPPPTNLPPAEVF